MGFREEAVELAMRFRCRDIADLGVWEGELSVMFAAFARHLVLVDPWTVEWNRLPEYTCTMGLPEKTQEQLDAMHAEVTEKVARAHRDGSGSVSVYRFPSLHPTPLVCVEDGSLDMVFIDSVHTYDYCRREIAAWLPKLRAGGIMAGDDHVPAHAAVARAVDEAFGVKPRLGHIWWERI